jgi:(+)-pinoresinol hydroxylase
MRTARLVVLTVAAALVGAAAHAQDAAAVKQGQQVYEYWCTPCHGKGERGYPGTTALQAKYKGALPSALEDRTDLTPAAIRFVVRRGISIMPFFRPTEVSEADLAALAAYLTRNPRAPAAAR